MQNITVIPPLNLQRPNTLVIAYGKQNDTRSRWYRAQLLSGDTPWTPPNNATASIRFAKPDGHGGWYDSLENGAQAVSFSGSTATMGLVTQVLTCPGDVKIDLMFADPSGSVLTAFSWTLRVEKNAIEDSLIEDSDDYFTILAGQVAQVQAAAAQVQELVPPVVRTEIPANANLEDYVTVGHYYSPNQARTETLSGLPGDMPSASFDLEVIRSGGAYSRIIYVGVVAMPRIFIQNFTDRSTMSTWRQIPALTWDTASGAAWRSSLGLGTAGALPITIGQGGTGATSVAGAKTALGFKTTMSPYSLFVTQAISTTGSTTYNTYDSRKFSDYTLLIFACGSSASNFRVTSIIPRTSWASGNTVYLVGNHGVNMANVSSMAFTYVSDTSFAVSTDGEKAFTYATIWGISLT